MARTTILPASGPVRTCVGCRRRAAKSELLRVVAGQAPDGRAVVVPDLTATAPGRGAHLHPTTECHELAVRRRAFPRAFRVTGNLESAPLGEYLAARAPRSTDQDDRPVINRPETGAGSS